jgi:putative NIF3 family GTP cyclohydrolase 1 type 2
MADPRTGYNNLTAQVYSSGTTLVSDPAGDLDAGTLKINSISTQYPGGLYTSADLFVPRDVVRAWMVNGGQRLVLRNGLTIVWEGVIDALPTVLERDGQGVGITGVGMWGTLLSRRTIDKRWSDQRLTDGVWIEDTTAAGAELFNIDRSNRIRFTPENQDLPASAPGAVIYTAPTCQLIRYIGFNYELQAQSGSDARNLELRLRDTTAGVTLVSILTSGCGTCAIIPASPRRSLQFQFMSNSYIQTQPAASLLAYAASLLESGCSSGKVTCLLGPGYSAASPLESGSYFGQVTSLDVRGASGNIISASIVKDIAAACADLNADRTRIGANNLALTPFITERPEALDSVLLRVAAYGDASANAWAPYVDNSETATTPDGKPVLVFEQQPAMTDYDYAIRLDEENLQPPLNIVRDFGEIVNWVTVNYRDWNNNRDVILTPDDDTTLKDTTSIAAYGQRDIPVPLDAGQASAATALSLGKRYLASYKDPKYYIGGPVTVVGYIRDKSGQPVPASQIRAGKRLKIENYLQDLSGMGLTVLITGTTYTDATESCSLSVGVPDNFAIFYAADTARRTI